MEEKKTESAPRSFWMFVAKAIVVTILLALFLDAFLPDFTEMRSEFRTELSQKTAAVKDRLVKTFGNERAKLYILSFVQNPAALYKTSELAEKDSKFESAIRDMELAVGLLEMHNADKQVIKRYNDRLDKLKAALAKAKK